LEVANLFLYNSFSSMFNFIYTILSLELRHNKLGINR